MALQNLTGTGVAVVTPFRNDSSIDFKSLEKIIEHIISGGVDYIVALGTTGEPVTLSKDEKKAVLNFIIDTVDKRVPVVVGIGGNNTQEVLNTISDNDFDNIDAILSVSPYYNNASQKVIYLHFKAIASASPVPVIIYNVPGRTGSNIAPETSIKLADELDNIIAIKEASGNLLQIMQIIKNKPANFKVISGDDALTLPIIAMGGEGVISVVANAFPKQFSNMVRFALKGEYEKARDLHFKLLDIINALFEEGSPSGVKAVLEIMKIAKNNVRLPLAPVSEKLYTKLEQLVKKVK